jgi:three-Cys-motif partner protein
MVAPSDFFSDPKWASIAKVEILQKYLRPFSYKLGSRAPRLWLVDGFAGAGAYRPDSEGRVQDGSPRAAGKLARELELKRGEPLLRTINVEADRATFVELQGNLAQFGDLTTNYLATFEDSLDEILKTVGRDPALFFLDPFGVRGIEMALIDRIRERSGKTELLIHFSDRSFLRMAGHLDENERQEVGQRAAVAKLKELDAVIASPLWRRIWEDKAQPTEARIEKIAALYCAQLRERGFTYVHEIRMRDQLLDRPKYRLVFCTRSADGVELMSQFACDYERALFERHWEGTFEIAWEEQRRQGKLAQLRDEIHAFGVDRGTATLRQVRHALVPNHFAEFRRPEYDNAVRELVDRGGIERKSRKGITENERLYFVALRQQSLFGSPPAS